MVSLWLLYLMPPACFCDVNSKLYRDSLQASAAILAHNIDRMTSHLAQHADLFQRVAVHPSANFPGRTHENYLMQALRKKLEPQTEKWVAEGRAAANSLDQSREKDDDELRDWAAQDIRDRIGEYVYQGGGTHDNYTYAERELGVDNVRTGLRRKLEDVVGTPASEATTPESEDTNMLDSNIVNAAETVTSAPEGQAQVKGLKRRLSDTMRYLASGDPTRRYASDLELQAKSYKSRP